MLITMVLLSACVDTSSSGSKNTSAVNDLNGASVKAQVEALNKSVEEGAAKKDQSHSMADNPLLFLVISFSVGALSASAVTAVIFRKKLSKL